MKTVMKNILQNTLIVSIFIGCTMIVQSCKEKLSTTEIIDPATPTTNLTSFTSNSSLSQQVVTVTDCNLNGWQRSQNSLALGTVTFVNGPNKPPSGIGSVQFNCPDMRFIRLKNDQFIGTLISDITELSYSTYVQISGAIVDNVFIVLQIDINNDGIVDFPVVFNPVYQTGHFVMGLGPDQGPIQMNIWQTWDLLNGVWWQGPTVDPDHGGVLFTLATLFNQYPDAKIMGQANDPGSIRINGGTPVFAGPFLGNADSFKIGINGATKIFDFEETTANAGPDQTILYGYGSNCTTLNGTALGGVAPYTYSWSQGGSTPSQASTEVCPTATTTYILTITDARGCTRTDDVTVFVNDVRCGRKMDKVKVCHNGSEICIKVEDVQSHLAHGDKLGSCATSPSI
jgi:hypothetical protein